MRRLLYLLLLFPLIARGQSVHITTAADTVCNGLPVYFTATDTGLSTPYFQWSINGIIIPGADSSLFISDSLSNGDSVVCLLRDSAHGSILAYSNGVVVTVLPVPLAGIITVADTNVCVGATITLTDTATGGVWSVSNSLATVTGGVVTGVTSHQNDQGFPSTDSIYYVVSNGFCSDTAYKIINVERKLYAVFYVGTYPLFVNSLCVGESLPVTTGDPDNGANGPMYSTNGNVAVSQYAVFGHRAGTDYIYCVASNACGTDTSGETITVNATPTITFLAASTTSICAGATTSIKDSTDGYPNWQASNDNASISLNGEVAGLSPGLDTITLLASNSCGYATTSVTINVEPPQPIIGIDSFCVGEKVKFFDSTGGGIWSSSDTALITIGQEGISTGHSEGGVLISYTLPSDGCVATLETKVRPDYLPSPVIGDAAFCLSGITYLSDSASGGVWTSSNTAVAQVTVTGAVSGMSDGTATITYSLGGCIQTMDVSVAECGNEMMIYPNPAHDEVTIYAFDNIYNTYTFFNAIGQEVMKGALAGPFTTVNVGVIAAGIYMIVITGEGDRYAGKFVKD